jgi:hypothetical protein
MEMKQKRNREYVKENKRRGSRKKEKESTGPKTGFGLLVHLPKLLVPYGEHTKPLGLLLQYWLLFFLLLFFLPIFCAIEYQILYPIFQGPHFCVFFKLMLVLGLDKPYKNPERDKRKRQRGLKW